MPVVDLNNKEEVKKYSEFVRNCKNTHIMQTVEWGKLKPDWKQVLVYAEENQKIIACASILIRKIPKTKYTLMYSPRGPVMDIYDLNLLKKLEQEIEEVAKKYNAFALKFDPEVLIDEELEKSLSKDHIIINRKVHTFFLIQARYGMVLNLDGKNEEELLLKFSASKRRDIKNAIKAGVEVLSGHNEELLKEFYEIHEVTGKRDGFFIRSYEYYKEMLELYGEENLQIFVAKHEKDILSAAILLSFNDKSWYISGASSNEKRKLNSPCLLQWEMIKYSIQKGMLEYDFGGVYTPTMDDGTYNFKLGFCREHGCKEYIGEIDKVYKKGVYNTYNILMKLYKSHRGTISKVLKIFKKK